MRPSLPPGQARLFAEWRAMFRRETLATDLAAALTVTMVALPLNLGLAVACGLPPHAGLVAAAAGGLVGAVFGGSRHQITGPEVALAPITLAIATEHGLTGLIVATVLAGLFQILFGLLKLGRIARQVPRPVIAGFMTAVGILVFETQLTRLLGLNDVHHASALTWDALAAISLPAVAIGSLVIWTLGALTFAPKWVPGPLVALTLGVALTAFFQLPVERIEPLAGASLLPTLPAIADIDVVALLPSAFALAMVASLDSLLCALSIDARTGERHASDQELVAQGAANVVSGLVAGMPVAAAVVRSIVAVEARAQTRLAAVVQSLLMLGIVLVLGAHLDHVPLAALAGVLLFVGARLIQVKELSAIAKVSRGEAAVFVVSTLAIVTLGFVEGVAVGVGLSFAALAYSLRSSLRGSVRTTGPASVLELEGALFASSAEHLRALARGAVGPRGPVVLDVSRLSVLDATGVAALVAAAKDLSASERVVHVVAEGAHLFERLRGAVEPHLLHGSVDAALAASARPAIRRESQPPPGRFEEAPAE